MVGDCRHWSAEWPGARSTRLALASHISGAMVLDRFAESFRMSRPQRTANCFTIGP